VQDGLTGLLVPPENADALAGALVQLFRNPEQARQIGSAGQRFAVENFSFERLIRDVDELYTELLDRAKHKR